MGNVKESHFGIMGLGTMGGAYAKNMYFRGFKISLWTKNDSEIRSFKQKLEDDPKYSSRNTEGNLEYFTNMEDFVKSLEPPRKILFLITAGSAVDSVLEVLLPLLENGDLVVDGGNEWYKNTDLRFSKCKAKGVKYAGMGISGGERGARNQPCLMFGGNREDYELLKPLLCQDDNDFYVGPGSSGHYVKMVHNGIEYALMQLISELYMLMRKVNKLPNSEIAEIFRLWNKDSRFYLLEITELILNEREGEHYLIDKISSRIESNGTGKWTVQDSFDRAVPVPSIGMAVDLRSVSNLEFSYPSKNPLNYYDENGEEEENYLNFSLDELKSAFVGSTVSILSQGLHLLKEASNEYNWNLDLSRVADIWSRNSIISCKLLSEVTESFTLTQDVLLLQPKFLDKLKDHYEMWKMVVRMCLDYNLPVPEIQTSLQYVQFMFYKDHSHNLIQAMRDCFGSHKFTRVDLAGKYHHNWWKNYDSNR